MSDQREEIVLGGGCFWCLEAVFREVRGVQECVSGYAGGHLARPSYEEVCGGHTGHAEVVQISFDPQVVSLRDLLRIFFTVHDPTTHHRQGADVGPQYRSLILYRGSAQKEAAEEIMREIAAAGIWGRALVTELTELEEFFPAEGYHQEYFERNPNAPYCRVVIEPKVQKFRQKFQAALKK